MPPLTAIAMEIWVNFEDYKLCFRYGCLLAIALTYATAIMRDASHWED